MRDTLAIAGLTWREFSRPKRMPGVCFLKSELQLLAANSANYEGRSAFSGRASTVVPLRSLNVSITVHSIAAVGRCTALLTIDWCFVKSVSKYGHYFTILKLDRTNIIF